MKVVGKIPWVMITVGEAINIAAKGGSVEVDGDRKMVIITYSN